MSAIAISNLLQKSPFFRLANLVNLHTDVTSYTSIHLINRTFKEVDMKLSPIQPSQFALWQQMRQDLYQTLSDEFSHKEMDIIYASEHWFCYFLVAADQTADIKQNTLPTETSIIGLVELSSRNVVDNCLTSPVAYLEGFYLREAFRGKGLGRKAMQLIFSWCKENAFQELATDTELTNAKAQKFYKNNGFQETERIVEYRIAIA